MLVSVADLIGELLRVAPDLLPGGGGTTINTLGRRTVMPLLSCPACAAPMEPVYVGGVDADRCYHDEYIWFDKDEQDIVIDRAREQHAARHPTLFARLRAALLD